MKKVLFLIESLSGGGAEKVLTTILKYIDKSKFEVTLCVIVDTGKYNEEVKQFVKYSSILRNPVDLSFIGRIWYSIKYNLVYKLLPLSWVYRLWIHKKYDTEIAFCEGFVTKLLSYSSNKKSTKISWVHIDLKCYPWTQKTGIFKSINEEIKTYSRFDRIVTVSRTVESSFKEIYGFEDKIVTIYNPIDVADIKERSQASILPFDKSYINLISVGRLVHQKGYDVLLKVIKHLVENSVKVKLRILGDGNQYGELDNFIKENQLTSNIELLGFKANPYPYIANSDIFICSSRSEGYSLVIAESLVLGIPVISTYCSGPNELLSEGEYGMLVNNVEDGKGLYNGILKLSKSQSLLDHYRTKSKLRGNIFSLQNVINQIENLI